MTAKKTEEENRVTGIAEIPDAVSDAKLHCHKISRIHVYSSTPEMRELAFKSVRRGETIVFLDGLMPTTIERIKYKKSSCEIVED